MKRVTLLVVIMTGVAASVGAAAFVILYETAFEQQRLRLVETAKSQARLMEAVARFDRTYNLNYPRGAAAATIEQIRNAHANYLGFGDTGEFTLARRDGDDIVFLLRHRHSLLDTPAPIPFQSNLAEPMRQALSGRSGTVVGPDYRGTKVLAAYEPVSVLDLGIVAKIDLAEIRAPFLSAFGIVIGLAITLIASGTILFYRVSNPIIQAIRESEERYRAVAEDTPVLICRFLPNTEIIYANEAYCRYFGKTSEALVGSSFLSLIPENNRKSVMSDIAALTPDSPTQAHEHQVVTPNGEMRWQRWTNRALFDAEGQAVAYQSIGEDITQRVRHESFMTYQARRAEALLELPRVAEELDELPFMQRGLEMAEELTESRISFVHFVNDDEQSIELVTWSRRTLEQYCSAIGESHYPASEAGIWADALRRYEPVVFNDYSGYEHKRGLPEGHAELTRVISLPVIENGKVVMLAGVGNKSSDYTDLDVETLQLIANAIWRIVQRRRSTVRLQLNEARYRELVESMTDGVAVYEAVESGQDFVFREHNRAGERITGMARNQVISRRFTEMFPNVEALGLLNVLRRVWRNGEAESYSMNMYKDERISLWIENYLFKLPSGEVVAVYSDMTKRKQAEEALHSSRERLRRLAARIEATREEERTAIAREVHDEFGQALTGLKMDLAWLRDHLAKSQTKAFTERLGAAEALADSTLDGMRRLAARLRPSLLDDLGLTAAIEWQVKEFASRVGCTFELDLTDDDIGLNRARDTAVYRILQEALTNVARHAQASQVTVSLVAFSDALELIVADNGKGIRSADMESVTSMGLTSMRERAGALGGQVDIRPRRGGGTRVVLRVPRSNEAQ